MTTRTKRNKEISHEILQQATRSLEGGQAHRWEPQWLLAVEVAETEIVQLPALWFLTSPVHVVVEEAVVERR